ncbi:hypothetical protein BLA29_002223 [Euroglyphus maynei]|uniref:dolichol kinase n=1 Tax=Euroglyphus maynei TaxID=6958 RepID=A0A1Y3BNV0_EURMA|nr:hypothetical protein BLA29_002223 [Euroglyphus maynei]
MVEFNRLNFRENIIDSKYILLLPVIAAYELWNVNNDHRIEYRPLMNCNLLSYYLLINACIVLFAYRFNSSYGLFTLFNASSFIQHCRIHFPSVSFLFLILIYNVITLKTLRILPRKYSKCFTFAEFAIVFQSIHYYVISMFIFNGQYWINGEWSVTRKLDNICLICHSTLAIHWIMAKMVRISCLDSIIFLISFPLSLYGLVYHFLSQEPLYWFINFFCSDQNRIRLLLFWSSVLLLTLLFVYIHTFHSVHRATTTATRKIFHLAISLVYITGIKYDIILLDFASKLILFIFIFIEIILASVVGITFGQRKWPKSRKTYLGTFGFFLSHSISFILFDYYFNGNFFNFVNPSHSLVIKVLIISTISCLYETFTKHVDNLILPLIEYLLIRILF